MGQIPEEIRLIGELPSTISIDATGLPTSIKFDSTDLPSVIRLEVPTDFPTKITIDASAIPTEIKVVGIPDAIELKGNIPSEINIKIPENLEVPLVYKGDPIRIQMDLKGLTGENGEDLPCFALVPCSRK